LLNNPKHEKVVPLIVQALATLSHTMAPRFRSHKSLAASTWPEPSIRATMKTKLDSFAAHLVAPPSVFKELNQQI